MKMITLCGSSTSKEIAYAKEQGKPVHYYSMRDKR